MGTGAFSVLAQHFRPGTAASGQESGGVRPWPFLHALQQHGAGMLESAINSSKKKTGQVRLALLACGVGQVDLGVPLDGLSPRPQRHCQPGCPDELHRETGIARRWGHQMRGGRQSGEGAKQRRSQERGWHLRRGGHKREEITEEGRAPKEGRARKREGHRRGADTKDKRAQGVVEDTRRYLQCMRLCIRRLGNRYMMLPQAHTFAIACRLWGWRGQMIVRRSGKRSRYDAWMRATTARHSTERGSSGPHTAERLEQEHTQRQGGHLHSGDL